MAPKKKPTPRKPAPKKKPTPRKPAPKAKPKPRPTVPKKKHPKARSTTSPMDVLANVRQAEALRLRIQGFNFREIGERLGVATATAHTYVAAALTELAEQQHAKAAELRAIEVGRLDELMRSLWPWATGQTAELIRAAVEKAEANGVEGKALGKLIASLPAEGIPDTMAAKRVLECIVNRSRLLGLEAPVKHAHTNPAGDEERPPGSYVFPMPPNMTPEAWQKFAAAALKAGNGG